MLQQTQVETVVPYFERWIAALPNVSALAAADEQTVLGLWAGLGYYSRARNLMAAAKIVERDHNGALPSDYEAFAVPARNWPIHRRGNSQHRVQQAYPVVDGNVRRVLSRDPGVGRRQSETIVGRCGEAGAARGAAVDQSGDHGARRNRVFIQGAALSGVPGSGRRASPTNRKAAGDSAGEETAGDGASTAVRGASGGKRPAPDEAVAGDVGVSRCSANCLRGR